MSTIKFPGKSASKVLPADYTYLPITMQQFENLTNEILGYVNALMAPHNLDADYLAQVLMSAIHALDHKLGKVKKRDLFEACVNRVSCHVTYHAVQEIQARIKAQGDAVQVPLEPDAEALVNKSQPLPTPQVNVEEILPDEVRGEMPPQPDTIA